MVGKRVPKAEVTIAAARAVKSGDIHEAGGGRYGYYGDSGPNATTGQKIVVHTDEVVELAAPSALVLAVNALLNFDLATQAAVASGGVNIGRLVYAKANGQTTVTVALNNTGMVVS